MSSATAKIPSELPIPERTYEWFNSLVDRADPVTEHELRSMWTEDCVMITNGQVKCAGLPAFVKHFNEIRHKLKSWKVQLPLAIRVAQNERIGVYYQIDIVSAEGSPAKVLVTAFFELRDGKASKMTEIAFYEGTPLQLDNH
jgi:hypothetical protein